MTAPHPEPAATFTTQGHPPVLIEDWLPIRELGIESVRERMALFALPPISLLHVWWARAPIAAANGVVLASLIPAWRDELTDTIPGLSEAIERTRANNFEVPPGTNYPTQQDLYHAWVLQLCGIWGDAVGAQELYDRAKAAGKRIPNPFTWKQAYKNQPESRDLEVLQHLLRHRWGRLPHMLDPSAGGGSIPYAALAYGIDVTANDLNPVAAGVLLSCLEIPTRYGTELVPALEDLGGELVRRCDKRLSHYFDREDEAEHITAYLFANTVACPRTGGPVPLAPNWWLDKSGDGQAVALEPVWADDNTPSHIEFHIRSGPSFPVDPQQGTVQRGHGVSPWDGLIVDSEYIKNRAQEGDMWPTLYAVAGKKPKRGSRSWRRYFRAPTSTDSERLHEAERQLESQLPRWEAEGIIPTERIPEGSKTDEPLRYGMGAWRDMFTPRQQLVHGVFIEEWRRLLGEAVDRLGAERGEAAMAVLALMQGKSLSFNSRLSGWQPSECNVKNVFDRHDFGFKWSFAEPDGASYIHSWALSQVVGAFKRLSAHLQRGEGSGLQAQEQPGDVRVPGNVRVTREPGARLTYLEDGEVECIQIDPPYYDNVMYGELSDFFYVWEKRTLGTIRSEWFSDELTNKDDEAVANVARFAHAGKRRGELATFDYRQKMQAIFAECQRVLADDGVMVVWFTHKEAEAWDTLGTAMMEAGFTIEASWPVATQSETSLHHAKKNSAKSTVMLVCRKRGGGSEGVFFDDIEAEVRQAARNAVAKFEADVGAGGVDLLLATYGPTLSVISGRWPVLSSEAGADGRARRLKPEEALDVAREEVARLRMRRLVGRDARFDPETDFWLLAWETFQARQFPYDDARRLALGVGLDVDDAIGHGLLSRKSGSVVLVEPSKRARSLRRQLDEQGRLLTLVDALHHLLAVYEEDGLAAARSWLAVTGYADESEFVSAVQAALNAVPRVRTAEGLALEEAAQLESAVVALFGDEITLPADQPESPGAEQTRLEV